MNKMTTRIDSLFSGVWNVVAGHVRKDVPRVYKGLSMLGYALTGVSPSIAGAAWVHC